MKYNILIVDDEPNIIMSLEYILKKENYEVHIARDGKEAINIVKESTIDVVLLDIAMSNVDGYQVLSFIRNDTGLKNVKVIFLTAKYIKQDIEKAYSLGVDKYISKPSTSKNIIAEINNLIKHH